MARIRKSDGTVVNVHDEDVWGKQKTEKQIAQEAREVSMPVTRMQLCIAMGVRKIITAQEARDFAVGKALPKIASDAISGLDEMDKLTVEIRALTAPTIHRLDQIFLLMQRHSKMQAEEIDMLFEAAATIK
jgi:hypothetical protein